MNGKQLKNSILQWAIQGKLVPQDPNDEPASVLLERIREEKARLVKEKKIKKDKNESIIFRGDDNSHYEKFADGTVKCIDDEIPFEIPAGWSWCKIKHICTMQAGKNIFASKIFTEYSDSHPYRCVGGNGLRGYTDSYNTSGHYSIVGRQGALCGCLNIENGDFYATEHAVVVDTYGIIPTTFIYYFLTALNLNQYATATAQPGLAVSNILEVMFPLPPIQEQQRIVEQIELIIPLVNKYEQSRSKLDSLNKTIYTQLKKSILQEAIQGKLVQQDPNDEPASVLLERIKEEKTKLFKEGKLKKKDLVDSVIFKGDDSKYYEKIGSQVACIDNEIPFEIPSSWSWIRLGNYTDVIGGYAFQSQDLKSENGCRVIRISDISEDGLVNTRIVRYNGKLDLSQYRIYNSDILMAMTGGTVGKSLLLKSENKEMLLLNQRVAIIRNTWFDVNYIDTVIKSAYIKSIIDNSKNSTNDNISMADITGFLIPIPPLNEQHRIINKLEFVIASIMRR